MKRIATINVRSRETFVDAGRYDQSGAICIRLSALAEEGYVEPLLTLTFNANVQTDLARDEFLVKNWNENEDYVMDVFSSGIFEDTGRSFSIWGRKAPIWRMKNAEHIPEDIPRRRVRKAA